MCLYHNFYGLFTAYLLCGEASRLDYMIGSLHIYVKFVFLCFHNNRYCTSCLIRVFKFHFKVFWIPCKVLLLRFWCYWAMKKKRNLPGIFLKNNVFIHTMCFLKKYNIKFRAARSLWSPFTQTGKYSRKKGAKQISFELDEFKGFFYFLVALFF